MRRVLLTGAALAAVAAAPPPTVLRPRAVLPGHAEYVASLAFSPDGKLLAVGSRGYDHATHRRWGEIKLWDVATGKARATWEGHKEEPSALAFSPDGKALFSVTSYLERITWDVATGRVKRSFAAHRSAITCQRLRVSADGKQAGTCGTHVAFLWGAGDGKELHSAAWAVSGWGSTLSHDLRLAAAPNHQDVDLWDVGTGKLVRSLLDHRGRAQALSFSRDDRLLAVGCSGAVGRARYESEVWLWDVAGGLHKRTIPLGNLFCRCVELSPAGDLLAVGGSYDVHGAAELRLFETATGREVARASLPPGARQSITNLTFSPNGRLLAAGCGDRAVRLWAVHRPRAASR
jgi:WD40 repeat protein